jgi:hypothetical protein
MDPLFAAASGGALGDGRAEWMRARPISIVSRVS